MKIIGLNILLALFCLACQHSACVINGTGMLSEQEVIYKCWTMKR